MGSHIHIGLFDIYGEHHHCPYVELKCIENHHHHEPIPMHVIAHHDMWHFHNHDSWHHCHHDIWNHHMGL